MRRFLAAAAMAVSAISVAHVDDHAAAGACTEVYAAAATIKGDGCTGTGSIQDDQMCFAYGEGPACRSVVTDGEQGAWVKEGETDGSGTIVPGDLTNS